MSHFSHAFFFGWLVAITAGCAERTVDVGSLAAGTAGTATASSEVPNGTGGRVATSNPSNANGSGASAQGGASAIDVVAGQGPTPEAGGVVGQGGAIGVGGQSSQGGNIAKGGAFGFAGSVALGGGLNIGGSLNQGGTVAKGGAVGFSGGVGGRENTVGNGGAAGLCLIFVACDPGYITYHDASQIPPGVSVIDKSSCAGPLFCAPPSIACDAQPICDSGDTEITGTCPPDLSCYQRTACNITINCRRNNCESTNEYGRRYASRDAVVCPSLDFLCPAGTTYFENACGCGCEQASTCPDAAACNPDATDQRGIDPLCGETTTCPYSPCIAGTTKAAGDTCNTCTCNADGTWICTRNACKPSCTPGATVLANDLCNICGCNADGTIGSCTKAGCDMATVGSIRPAGDGCNTCVFTKEGTWSCTQLKCLSCTPGSTASATDGCNVCTCSSDGKWECTAKECTGCTKDVQRLVDGCNMTTCVDNGSGPAWSAPTEMGCGPCTPGTIKTAGDYCNACACQPDGRWLCTNNVCPSCSAGDKGYDNTSKCGGYTCNSYGGWQAGGMKC